MGLLPSLVALLVGFLFRLFVLIDQGASQEACGGSDGCALCRITSDGADHGTTRRTDAGSAHEALLALGHVRTARGR
jgi:hypothetical protein